MTDNTKIELSRLELELMKNPDWILTKHSVTKKISSLFSDQIAGITKLFSTPGAAFEEIISTRPKISKGERYEDLPYIMLDYPAVFSRENIFALRTMFWWGNFISVTLHLSGKYKNAFQQKIIDNIDFATEDLFFGINEDQWQHHFAADNYMPLTAMDKSTFAKKVAENSFCKIALRYKLEGAHEMDKNIKKSLSLYGRLTYIN